jgi:hypothetical protein
VVCNAGTQLPLRPSTTLNTQAATRFIGHSLSHLTFGTYLDINFMWILDYYGMEMRFFYSDQKRSMHAISIGERRSWSGQKRKPEPSVEKKSVRAAAEDFFAKVSQKLLDIVIAGSRVLLYSILMKMRTRSVCCFLSVREIFILRICHC